MAHHGKAYNDAKARFDRQREYTPTEAIALVKQLGSAKFDESVEVHLRTGLNVRHADEQLRGTIALPTASARTSRSPSSPRATRPARRRRPAPTSSAARISRRASRRASTTSTSRSRPRT